MQYLDGLLAIGGDIRNRLYKKNMSVAEVSVLRAIHGDDSVAELRVVSKTKARFAHDEERARLLLAYPKHSNIVIGLYRDFGGKFPVDIRDLKLPTASFSNAPTVAFDQAEALEELEKADAETDED